MVGKHDSILSLTSSPITSRKGVRNEIDSRLALASQQALKEQMGSEQGSYPSNVAMVAERGAAQRWIGGISLACKSEWRASAAAHLLLKLNWFPARKTLYLEEKSG